LEFLSQKLNWRVLRLRQARPGDVIGLVILEPEEETGCRIVIDCSSSSSASVKVYCGRGQFLFGSGTGRRRQDFALFYTAGL
jgi:hypothetical protein